VILNPNGIENANGPSSDFARTSAERPGSLDADMLIDDGYARAIHHFSFFVAIKT